jgi:hypothetical protein
LRSHDGQWVPVKEVLASGEESTVYNLRIADYHTYFVGDTSWGFSVWAHNVSTIDVRANGSLFRSEADAFTAARQIAGVPKNLEPTRIFRIEPPTSTVPRGTTGKTTVITATEASHQGVIFEYNVNGRYVYIVQHTNDTLIGRGHFHVGQSPLGPSRTINPGDRYLKLNKDTPWDHLGYE